MDSSLAIWLRSQIKERGTNAHAVGVKTGIGGATLSYILNDGHIPRIDTLTRLADFSDTPREAVLRLAVGLPFRPLSSRRGATPQDDD
jgi:hypothetical protein